MARLKTDSPLSCRIVLSFLDFLNLVEPASGVDLEGLEVAKECLAEVFKIDPSADGHSKPDSLIDIFTSWEDFKQSISESDLKNEGQSLDARHTSTTADANIAEPSQPEAQDWTRGGHTLSLSKDELLGQFFGALEKIHYFRSMPDGHDDQAQLDKASNFLHNAVMEMEKSGCQTFDQRNLAETFKSQGNKAMQSKLYYDAIELYTFAIALCEDNAVYHCNRAAAYTQINKYAEAIRDCQKSIEIDPNYSKAYSRLGFAYYAQGNYRDAIDKGFKKALQLDPSNDSVKENIRVAEQRLQEEQQSAEHDQNSSSSSHHGQSNHQSSGESRGQDAPPPFTSMPFSANGIPTDITSMLMNMAANVYQGQNSQDRAASGNNSDSFNDPGIRVGGNFNVNLGEQVPEELSGALRSVMEMFTGGGPQTNSEDDGTGRSASS